MNFIVVGCGRVGAELAYRLFKTGHQIVVVDNNREAFNRLHPDFRGRTLEGEGLAESVLERAGIREAHGLAAVTNSDTLNAVVAHTARAIYDVPIVVARNYDPELRPLIEAFGLQTVSSTYWGAQRVEELLTNPLYKTVYSAGNGEVEVYELIVPERLSRRVGRTAPWASCWSPRRLPIRLPSRVPVARSCPIQASCSRRATCSI
jgi:trk system potassium uptake protein